MSLTNFAKQVSMNLKDQDFEWIARTLRSEFDTPRHPYEYATDMEIIDRARRFGLHDLADSMQNDVMISAHVNINNVV